ncbi:hypothetical protein CL634_11675 [bacterium]|nr:hypothetical protein [bacterium]
MRLTESNLRYIIRQCLMEQVLGYTPPSKSKPSGYMGYGDLSQPAPTKPSPDDDPEDYEQLESQEQELSQKRQKSVNKGDAPTANYDARVLQRLKDATG